MTDNALEEMETSIVGAEQRRVLNFIAVANSGGYRPTGREINEWRRRPGRKPARKGKLLAAEIPARRVRVKGAPRPGTIGAQLASMNDMMGRHLAAQAGAARLIRSLPVAARAIPDMSVLMGYEKIIPGEPAVYGPGQPREKFLAHLCRLGWIQRDRRRRYAVTQLGHALLRAAATEESAMGDSSVIVLGDDNELAYAQVVSAIAECGDALVVDGYLGAEQLMQVLRLTGACRFLVGTKLGRGRTAALGVMIESTIPGEGEPALELRQAAGVHDRWVVGDDRVYGLGSSLNSVGKNTTTLIEISEPTAGDIRARVEDLWDGGEVVATSQADEADQEVPTSAVGNAVQEVDGRFMHGQCTVRHKLREAAERCPKG